jgi:hypothetical protein
MSNHIPDDSIVLPDACARPPVPPISRRGGLPENDRGFAGQEPRPQADSLAFEVNAFSTETAKTRLLEREGYAPVRYFCEMVRHDLEAIPYCPVPPGLEVRPARPEHRSAVVPERHKPRRSHGSDAQQRSNLLCQKIIWRAISG